MKKLFRCKKIVYSKRIVPAELVKYFTHKGQKYVRVAITNRVKFKNTIPMTDIRIEDVTAIRKLPSPFKKGICNILGIKPRAKTYKMQK